MSAHQFQDLLGENGSGHHRIAASFLRLLFQVDLYMGDEAYGGDGGFFRGPDQIERIGRGAVQIEDHQRGFRFELFERDGFVFDELRLSCRVASRRR